MRRFVSSTLTQIILGQQNQWTCKGRGHVSRMGTIRNLTQISSRNLKWRSHLQEFLTNILLYHNTEKLRLAWITGMIFEVLAMLNIKITSLQDVVPCSLLHKYGSPTGRRLLCNTDPILADYRATYPGSWILLFIKLQMGFYPVAVSWYLNNKLCEKLIAYFPLIRRNASNNSSLSRECLYRAVA
jgi:hypothetical protein